MNRTGKTLLALFLLFILFSGCIIEEDLKLLFEERGGTAKDENVTPPSLQNDTIPVGELDKRAPPPLPEG